MKIRKRLPALASLAVAALLTLTACSAPPSRGGPVQVTFWHEAGGPGAIELTRLISRFNAEHAGRIVVKASFQGSYTDAQTKYTASVQTGTTPSLLMMNDIATGFMIDSKQTTPLDRFADSGVRLDQSAIVPAARAYYAGAGGLAAVPFSLSMPVMYLDKALVRKAGLDIAHPPTTFAETITWAKRIRATTGAYGLSLNMNDSWMIEQLTAAGGQDLCVPGNGRSPRRATSIDLTSPLQLRFLTDLRTAFADGTALNPGTNASAMVSAFAAGRVGIMLTSTGAYTAADPKRQRSTVSSFPRTSAATAAGPVIGGNALWISGPGHSQREQLAAFTLAAYLASPAVQAEWSAATGYLATSTASTATPVGRRTLQDPNVVAMYRQLGATGPGPATAGCRTGAFPTLRATILDAFTLSLENGSVADRMRTAEAQARAQLSTYNLAAQASRS